MAANARDLDEVLKQWGAHKAGNELEGQRWLEMPK